MKTKITFILVSSLICIGLFSWTWPLSNSSSPDTFTSPFGPRECDGYDFHRGIDLRTSLDTDVYTIQTETGRYSGLYDNQAG